MLIKPHHDRHQLSPRVRISRSVQPDPPITVHNGRPFVHSNDRPRGCYPRAPSYTSFDALGRPPSPPISADLLMPSLRRIQHFDLSFQPLGGTTILRLAAMYTWRGGSSSTRP
jgi:hypothetical protein